MSEVHTIHTNLYGDTAFEIISSLHNALKTCWRTRQMKRNMTFCSVTRAPDNEVLIEYGDDLCRGYSYYRSMWYKKHFSDNEVRKWFASHLKTILIREFRYTGEKLSWKRKNVKQHSTYISWTDASNLQKSAKIAECYAVFDALYGNKLVEKRYPKGLLTKLIGKQLDPLCVEAELARREQVKLIKEEYDRSCAELDNERNKLLEEYRIKLINEFEEKKRQAAIEREKKIAELNEMLAFMNA